MQIWVCKMCGRAMIVKDQPKYCYFDRGDSIEQIGVDDSIKMGLFFGKAKEVIETAMKHEGVFVIPEFGPDLMYNPLNGEIVPDVVRESTQNSGMSLPNYQRKIMGYVNK